MRNTRWWLGLLCLAGAACADGAPPLATAAGLHDLDFTLPAIRGELPVLDREIGEWEGASSDPTAAMPSLLEDTMKPLIWSTVVTSWFRDNYYVLNYGLTGFGNYYVMRPNVQVMTDAGHALALNVSSGRSEEMGIPYYMKPFHTDRIWVDRDCGMRGNAIVSFEVGLWGGFLGNWREHQIGSTSVDAPSCHLERWTILPDGENGGAGGSGGAIGDSSGGQLYICYWDVWTDAHGRVVDALFLGCHQLPGGYYLS